MIHLTVKRCLHLVIGQVVSRLFTYANLDENPFLMDFQVASTLTSPFRNRRSSQIHTAISGLLAKVNIFDIP